MHDNGILLQYTASGEEMEYMVPITYSECNFGGKRPWFRCPSCGKRVGVLYSRNKFFKCRDCLNLAYQSQCESDHDKHLNKAQKIREDLGGSLNIFDPFPDKPKNMHWKTYYRFKTKGEQAEKDAILLLNK